MSTKLSDKDQKLFDETVKALDSKGVEGVFLYPYKRKEAFMSCVHHHDKNPKVGYRSAIQVIEYKFIEDETTGSLWLRRRVAHWSIPTSVAKALGFGDVEKCKDLVGQDFNALIAAKGQKPKCVIMVESLEPYDGQQPKMNPDTSEIFTTPEGKPIYHNFAVVTRDIIVKDNSGKPVIDNGKVVTYQRGDDLRYSQMSSQTAELIHDDVDEGRV